MTVQFSQVDPRGLYASSASGDAGVPGYWAGFWAPAVAGLGPTASVSATWNTAGGTYLFVATTPTSLTAFYDALTAWFPSIPPVGQPRFVWLENPEDPWPYWRVTAWYAAAGGTPTARTWTTFGLSTIRLGAYTMEVASGSALTLTDGTVPVVSLPSGSCRFYALSGAFTPTGTPTIAFASSTIGTLATVIPVSGQDLGALGVELRYAIRRSVNPNDPRLSPISMPVMTTLAQATTLAMLWDPLNPFARGRTEFRFATGASIAASFVTQRGYATTLATTTVAAPLWQGGLMFTRCATRIDGVSNPGGTDLYSLAPDGAFQLQVVPPQGGAGAGLVDQLMLGQSGLETAQLSQTATLVLFTAGNNAFAQTVALDGTLATGGNGVTGTTPPLLTDLATTSWVSVMPASTSDAGLLYYAQPRQSPLFTSGGGGAMPFQQVPAARFAAHPTTSQSLPANFPVGVYAGVASNQIDAARALETAALAPLRRSQIVAGTGNSLAEVSTDVLAITPQGLVVEVDTGQSSVTEVIIASLPGTDTPTLALADPKQDFLAGLFANQLFFVVSNPTVLTNQATCVPPFSLDLDGWTFSLDPSLWRTGDNPTLMLWKYANRSIEDLAANPAGWGWPQAAADSKGSLAPTALLLNAIIAEAKRAATSQPDGLFANFYNNVLADSGWNGVLFLNAPIGLGTLPASLKFLSAGIDQSKFFAHHVGVGQTPFDPATTPITLKQSSVFGLIDYNDPVDLVPSSSKPFVFKTLQLTAQFANAHLAAFSTQVELSLNQLFGSPLAKKNAVNGNNLVVSGTLQTSGGSPAYAFALTGENKYSARNAVLLSVEITSLRIETQSTPLSANQISTNFVLGGKMRFIELAGFDLYSYGPTTTSAGVPFDGYLIFNQLALTMDFLLTAPNDQLWSANETGINFDVANSVPRPDSLVNCFPVAARSLVASPNLTPLADTPTGVSPEDLGYLSIAAPIDQVPMTPTWYGLTLALDLGSLGALVGGVGIKAEILAAWQVGIDYSEPSLYLGLKLPGTTPRAGSFPLQGILKLGFQSFIFSTYQQNGKRAYLLRLSRFGLSVLGFHFPPGNLDISLFGGPDGRSRGQLGWLAAYVDPDKKKKDKAEAARVLASGSPAAIAADASVAKSVPAPEPRLSRAKRLGRIPPRS